MGKEMVRDASGGVKRGSCEVSRVRYSRGVHLIKIHFGKLEIG